MSHRPCPICRAAAAPRPGNPAAPFCSDRCRLIDLGRWLTEGYRVPDESTPPGDGERQDEGSGQ